MAQEILLGRSVRVNVFAINLESQRSTIGSQLCVTWCLHPIRNKIENCLVTMVLHTHIYLLSVGFILFVDWTIVI